MKLGYKILIGASIPGATMACWPNVNVPDLIDRHYSLEETGAALEYIATGRARGKVVVTLQ